jgi:hypothetical protein
MDEHEEKSRADAAQDADATQFVTVDMLPDESPGPRRRGLLLAVALGILVGLALLAVVAYVHRGHPIPARAGAHP